MNLTGQGLWIVVLGFAIVIALLIIIVMLSKILRVASGNVQQVAPAVAQVPAVPVARTQAPSVPSVVPKGIEPVGDELFVVAAAAITASLNKAPEALKVVSITKVG